MDWKPYCVLRNRETSLNRKQSCQTPAFIQTENSFLTKPSEIANYFNDVFRDKVEKLRQNMSMYNSAHKINQIVNDDDG